MLCNVTISGSKDADVIRCKGELEIDDKGFVLRYNIAEDRCVLTAHGCTVTQSRRGDVNTEITFAKGRDTVCMLLSGELTGSIPVKTTYLKIDKGADGVALSIDYFLGGANILLRLTAAPVNENYEN